MSHFLFNIVKKVLDKDKERKERKKARKKLYWLEGKSITLFFLRQ